MTSGRGVSPVRGPYTVKNPMYWCALRIADAILGHLRRHESPLRVATPRRVLLASGGHLGDAVVLTASIRRVRELLPEVEIGILLPSWSRVVVEGHPDVRWVHTLDHWRRNRSRVPLTTKYLHYRRSRRAAVREIRATRYDVAFDMYAYSPNMVLPLRECDIPIRAGFVCGGLSAFYTHALGWGRSGRHMMERQAELISHVLTEGAHASPMQYDLPVRASADIRTSAALRPVFAIRGGYMVVHMGSGRAAATWPEHKWIELVQSLRDRCEVLVFTGRGEAEGQAIGRVVQAKSGSVDLTDAVDWNGFVEVIRGARMVITVDTAASHVAAAVGTAAVVIWPEIVDDVSWYPRGPRVQLVPSRAGADEVAAAVTRAGTFPRYEGQCV